MKVVRSSIGRIFSCFSFIIAIIKKMFGRGRHRKNSTESSLPTAVTVEQKNSQTREGIEEWQDWGKDEQFSIKIEPSSPPPENQPNEQAAIQEQDLFKDMTPVFMKPKKIVLKKNTPDPNQHLNNSASRLNFDMSYPPVQTDLGSWEDGASVWEEDGITEREIEWQTEKVVREKKQAERERRAVEQQRKKEENEASRHTRRMQQHLGTKVHS